MNEKLKATIAFPIYLRAFSGKWLICMKSDGFCDHVYAISSQMIMVKWELKGQKNKLNNFVGDHLLHVQNELVQPSFRE